MGYGDDIKDVEDPKRLENRQIAFDISEIPLLVRVLSFDICNQQTHRIVTLKGLFK
jgi:hypothetical protein